MPTLRDIKHWGGTALSLLLLVVGGYVVYRLLREHSLGEIAEVILERPASSLVVAALFAGGSWLALTTYDALAFRVVHEPVPWKEVARDAFASYAISFNVGASAVSGSAVRLRLYRHLGFGANEVSRIMACNITTMWVGWCALAGLVLTLVTFPIPEPLHVARGGVKAIGAVAFLLAVLYLLLSWRRRRPLRIRSWEYPLVPLPWALVQIAVSTAHWALAAAAVHALLPDGSVSYVQLLGLYLLTAVIGVVAHVPGGLGVIETVFVLSLRDVVSEPAVLASILAFRVLFYWLPLLAGLLLLADHELLRPRRRARRLEGAAAPG